MGFRPVGNISQTPDKVGYFQSFRRQIDNNDGAIYWSPNTGAHLIYGAIYIKWMHLGGTKSVLGYPTTDETGTPDGIGRFNHFQRGSIYWTQETGAFEVHGEIRETWESLGWEKGELGYPLSDVKMKGNRQYSEFQGGIVFWSPAEGIQIKKMKWRSSLESSAPGLNSFTPYTVEVSKKELKNKHLIQQKSMFFRMMGPSEETLMRVDAKPGDVIEACASGQRDIGIPSQDTFEFRLNLDIGGDASKTIISKIDDDPNTYNCGYWTVKKAGKYLIRFSKPKDGSEILIKTFLKVWR